MNYVPTNAEVQELAERCVILCTALVAKTNPLLDVGSRTSVTLAAMTTGVSSMATFAMALNEIAVNGIAISTEEMAEQIHALISRPDYVERVHRLHGKIKRAILDETGLPNIKLHDKTPDN